MPGKKTTAAKNEKVEAVKAEKTVKSVETEKVEEKPVAKAQKAGKVNVEKKTATKDETKATEKAPKKTAKKGGAVAEVESTPAPVPTPAPTPAPATAPEPVVEQTPVQEAESKSVTPAKGGAKSKSSKGAKSATKKTAKVAKATKSAKKSASKAVPKKGGAEETESSSRTRYFKVKVEGQEAHGRFSGSKPKQAANKALTSILKAREKDGQPTDGQIRFSIVECTRGSKHKPYHYIGERVELPNPMKVPIGKGDNAKEITYRYNNHVMKDKEHQE